MKESTKSFFRAFIPGFLATVLGILLTFGADSWNSARKREKTAKLLAGQIVGKMDRTYKSLMEYQELYDTIDSTSMCLHLAILADTLERVDTSVAITFINSALSEYVQADVDSGVDAYKDAILSNIGNVELLGHIDEFYSCARQYADVSAQVVNQKRVVRTLFTGIFTGNGMSRSSITCVTFMNCRNSMSITPGCRMSACPFSRSARPWTRSWRLARKY